MTLVVTASWIDTVGRSLREGFFMFWETLWPLILGFGLSGAVQSFVSRASMQSAMGDHRPASVTRASLYGMVSSSCSYAATAMAKSIFVKGADFVAVCVFMFASTNLVLELGIVLIVLMGWQFAASEFVGGLIMIGLLAATFGLQHSSARQFGIQELSTTVLTSTIVSLGLDSRLAGGTGARQKLRFSVVFTICAGALLGATMSRYVVAPVFAVTAAVVAASLLIFRFGPTDPKHAAVQPVTD